MRNSMTTQLEDYIDKAEFARKLGVTPRTIDRWHTLRTGPPRVKAGKRVLYSLQSIASWLQQQEQGGRV